MDILSMLTNNITSREDIKNFSMYALSSGITIVDEEDLFVAILYFLLNSSERERRSGLNIEVTCIKS